MRGDLAEELSQSYQGTTFKKIEVPRQLLDRLFPDRRSEVSESAAEQKSEECQREIDRLLQLAEGAFYSSQFSKAKSHAEQALALARETGSRKDEGRALGRLGSIYAELQDTVRALDCFKQSQTIAREIGDRQLEGTALGGVGTIASTQGHYEEAISYIDQAVAIAREGGNAQLTC
jgi:tetratricopeptide (TPR) repeat protein